MYRIEKFALFAGIAGFLLFVLVPPILRSETDKRNAVTGGVRVLAPAFPKVQQSKGGAVLWARPPRQRGYRITLDGSRDYEWKLGLGRSKTPVPFPVKVGTQLVFAYRHNAYFYRVTGINPKGVEVEVGGQRSALFFRNQTVFLPWK